MKTQKMEITKKTYSIHHYDSTWYGNGVSAIIKKKLLPLKVKSRILIDKYLGEGSYDKIKAIIKK